MIKLGNEMLGAVPKIVVAITDLETNKEIISSRADVLEVRVDGFKDTDILYVKSQLERIRTTGLPLILTIRNDIAEGARVCMDDARKDSIFKSVIELIDAVDIELSSVILSKVMPLAKENGKVVIVSTHNFQHTAPNQTLENTFERAQSLGADIVKIAMQANTKDDVARLMSFTLAHRYDNIITMSLGALGSLSRLVYPSIGSLLTYSYIQNMTAPGQISLPKLQADMCFYYPDYNAHFIQKKFRK